MKTLSVLTIVAVCAFSAADASAQGRRSLEQVEKSYELVIDQVTLPSSGVGTVIFKECDTCQPVALRVNGGTQYFLNGTAVPLANLQRAAAALRQQRRATDIGVYVHYDIASKDVTRIRVEELGR